MLLSLPKNPVAGHKSPKHRPSPPSSAEDHAPKQYSTPLFHVAKYVMISNLPQYGAGHVKWHETTANTICCGFLRAEGLPKAVPLPAEVIAASALG